tara:strand:+ start:16490 stop:16729 length:240 start_codon:yes stop_codon:yes gene_type:complete
MFSYDIKKIDGKYYIRKEVKYLPIFWKYVKPISFARRFSYSLNTLEAAKEEVIRHKIADRSPKEAAWRDFSFSSWLKRI